MENRRFLRTEALLGHEGMERLRGARVMVVGLGAVGGYALEALARAGVGHLTLVDFDVFDESNINRQILALNSTVGRKKTEVARERVLDINPDCDVKIIETFVNADTLPQLLAEPVDYVVDAIDALNPKCCLMETLYRNGIPFVSSMGAALKTDVSRIGLRPAQPYRKLQSGKVCTQASQTPRRRYRQNCLRFFRRTGKSARNRAF